MHFKKLLLALVATLGLVGASLMLGNAQANALACFTNEGFRTVSFAKNGAAATEVDNAVRVVVTTRQYGTCTGGLPQTVDAAVSIYNNGNGGVTAVDAHAITLYADNQTTRTNTCYGCPDGGEPTHGFTYTPQCTVSPFGSGAYYAVAWVQWRLSTGALIAKTVSSFLGPRRYATQESVPCGPGGDI